MHGPLRGNDALAPGKGIEEKLKIDKFKIVLKGYTDPEFWF